MGYEDPGSWKQKKVDRKQRKVEKLSEKISKVEAGTKNPARLQQLKTRLQTARGGDPTKTSESGKEYTVEYDPDPTTTTSSAVPSFRSGGPTTGTSVDPKITKESLGYGTFTGVNPIHGKSRVDPTASRSDYVSMKKTAEKAFDPNKGLPIGTGIPSGTVTGTGTGTGSEVNPLIDPSKGGGPTVEAAVELEASDVKEQKRIAGNVELKQRLVKEAGVRSKEEGVGEYEQGEGPKPVRYGTEIGIDADIISQRRKQEAESEAWKQKHNWKEKHEKLKTETGQTEIGAQKSVDPGYTTKDITIKPEKYMKVERDLKGNVIVDPGYTVEAGTRTGAGWQEKSQKYNIQASPVKPAEKSTFRERRKAKKEAKQEEKLEKGYQKAIKQRESYKGSTGSSNDPFIYKPN